MSDVFISYSREDQGIVRRLNDALVAGTRKAWVDWEGIPPTAEWLTGFYQAIDAADTFIFALSSQALTSETCRPELAHLVKQNKRIVPLLLANVDVATVPESVAQLNWIMLREQDDFDAGIPKLDYALSMNLDWVKAHTRLLVRAREWETKERDPSYLLAGSDLDEVQRWLSGASEREPQVTQLQIAYVAASQQGVVARQ